MKNNNKIKVCLFIYSIFLLPLFVMSCSKPPADLSPLINEYKESYPTCDTKKDCDVLWGKAIEWIKSNSDLGVDVDSEDLVRTHTLEMKNKKLVKVVDEIIYADERDRVRAQEFEEDKNRGDYIGPEMKLIRRYIGSDHYRLELKIACEAAWIDCEESLLEQIRFNRELRGEDYPFADSATEKWLLEG
jgi:hypothetical protein